MRRVIGWIWFFEVEDHFWVLRFVLRVGGERNEDGKHKNRRKRVQALEHAILLNDCLEIAIVLQLLPLLTPPLTEASTPIATTRIYNVQHRRGCFAPGSRGTKTPLIESGFRDCGTIGARHCSLSSRRLSSMRLSADLSSLPRLAR